MNMTKVFAISIAALLVSGCEGLPFKKSPDPIVITEPASPDVIQSTLNKGETLWDFSERTTGSGFNWEKIALLNDIKDERNVDAGLVLIVPPELALDELKAQ